MIIHKPPNILLFLQVDSTSKTLTSSSQASPVNSYIIYDTLSINSNDNDDIEVYIHQVESAWTQVIGKSVVSSIQEGRR